MLIKRSIPGCAIVALFGASHAHAQKAIPVRAVTPPDAITSDTLSSVFGVRELADGRVIVNDAGARRLLLLEKSLRISKVVADTLSQGASAYGMRGTGIIPFTGDSTLLVDVYSRGFVVVGPDGKATRTIAAPQTRDVAWLANPSFGQAAIDPKGRLVYRGYPAFRDEPRDTTQPPPPDSAPIIRADFDKRLGDTIALLGIPAPRGVSTKLPDGRMLMQLLVNPLPLIDDWTPLPDGTVAVLRGGDYHIDWIGPDGARSSSPKMPFDWKRLSDADKQTIVDSTKRAVDAQWALQQAAAASGSGGASNGASVGAVASFGGGAPPDGPRPSGPINRPPPQVFPAKDLPDYIPPVLRQGLMRADPDGNVWILPSTSSHAGGGLMYDVVNRKGEVFQRVQLAEGQLLAGFGSRETVYLTSHDATGTHLVRARLAPIR